MNSLISNVIRLLSEFFIWKTAETNNQATSEVIDDKKDLEKACRFAESAIELVEQNATFTKKRTHAKFIHFVRKFRRYK